MRILIVEDETRIAKRLQRLIEEIIVDRPTQIFVKNTLFEAEEFIDAKTVDILFLDLNLNGKNGFEMLQRFTAEAFYCIIVSAYEERAKEAFEYGVIDFVSKPFDKDRLQKAIHRVLHSSKRAISIKFLSIKNGNRITLLKVAEIIHIMSCEGYSEVSMKDGSVHLSSKSLEVLEHLLPPQFARIHKSYIANMEMAAKIISSPGSKYELKLSNKTILPVGRSRYKELKKMWH